MPREVIVPGVRDLIPPQGLVTVQLTNPETGKVKHEVKAENMLMNSWLAQVNVHARGALDRNDARNQYQPNFSPVSGNADAGFAREHVWAHLGRPGIFPGLFNAYMPWLWGSDKNIAPNANRTCPPCTTVSNGNMTGHARLDLAHTSQAGHLNRGTSIASESWHKWDQSRVTVEFASTEGNGTYRSIGVGRLASHYDENRSMASPIACVSLVALRQQDSQQISSSAGDVMGLGGAYLRSAAFEDTNHFWLVNTSHNLYVYDWETDVLTTGPSSGSIVGTGQVGICQQGGSLWLSRDKQVLKCSKYTGGSLSVLNTYNLATPLGAEIFWDITSDGTNLYGLTATKVFVINPADGTVTSSWTHGLTHSDNALFNNIEWDPANQVLWIYFGINGEPPYHNNDYNTINWVWGLDYAPYARVENLRAFGFSTAGVAQPYQFVMVVQGYRHYPRNFTGIDSQGWVGILTSIDNNNGWSSQTPVHLGGMMGSHALLPSDVVKTAADGLKIRYDFDFA